MGTITRTCEVFRCVRSGLRNPSGIGVAMIALAFFSISCGKRAPEPSMTSGHAVVLASDAAFNMAWKLSQEFQSVNRGAFVDVVRGLNSELIDSLVNKESEQIFLDRELSKAESLALSGQNLRIYTYPVAYYPVYLLVDTATHVAVLDSLQLRRILTGELGNWKSLGGSDHRINVYGPPPGEGAWHSISSFYGPFDSVTAIVCPTAQAMLDSAQDDPGALLIYSHPYDDTPYKRLAFRRGDEEIPANVRQIVDEPIYPFRLNFTYVTTHNKQDVAAGYLTYSVSNMGQRRVMSLGYRPASVPVRVVKMKSQ